MADSKNSGLFLFCETLVIPKKAFLSAQKIGNALQANCRVRVTWKNSGDDTEQSTDIDVSNALHYLKVKHWGISNDEEEERERQTAVDVERHATEILRNIYAQLNQ
jgi:hypothetical protein